MDDPDAAGAQGVLGVLGLLLGVAYVAVALWVALVVVPRDRRPSSATAWILLILTLPTIGLLAFLLIGNPRLPAARRAKQRDMTARIHDAVASAQLGTERAPGPEWLDPLVRLQQALGAQPMLGGNSVHIRPGYVAAIHEMAADVDAARDYVHVEFYILSLDPTTAPFFEALARAVSRGVDVRVLLDHMGSRGYPDYAATRRFLTDAGVRWQLMLPVQPLKGRYQRPDLRNHRKLVVVDGVVAWAGSMNMIDAGYNKRANRRKGLQWHDLMVRVRGHAALGLDALFLTDWFCETDELLPAGQPESIAGDHGTQWVQVVPSGPGFDNENNLRLFNALLYGAERRISITSPYFVPDESLLYGVTAAALRGVQVELFVPYKADQMLVHHAQRSYYEPLLRAGVRIHRYPEPFVLHAKHVSVDEDVCVVGSSNLDIRSFTLDLESSLLVQSREFGDELRAVEDGYRERSTELTLEHWTSRPRHQQVADNLARLTSALM